MKKLLLSVAGFCLLASFTINTRQTNGANSGSGSIAFECPKCKEEFAKCLKPLDDAYISEFSIACDKFNKGKISREEFKKARKDAENKKSKPENECMMNFNECCLKETREIMDKEKGDSKDL